MLSKEEIEKAKEDLIFFNEGDYITKEMAESADILEEYIKQLESNKQKLIEKLEEEIKKNEWSLKGYDCTISDYKQSQAIGAWNVLQKIRQEIVKGEKNA